MATGTSAGLLDQPHSQSVFKHAVLKRYVIPFAEMTDSHSQERRVVIVDGFAGRGTYEDGSPGSAGYLLQAAAKAPNARIDVHLGEANPADYQQLESLAETYRARGIVAPTYPNDIRQHLPTVLRAAAGVPLFLFLDPCGAGLSFVQMTGILTGPRRPARPATEVLLNFSADLTRRAAGTLLAGQDDAGILTLMDEVCGGVWWREITYGTSTHNGFGELANTIANFYGQQLAKACDMHYAVVPVRRRSHHQPIYHLVFLTRSPYGLWVFADAIAKARRDWMMVLGPEEDAEPDALIPFAQAVETVLEGEHQRSIASIEANLKRLLAARTASRKLVDDVEDVFRGVYGEADEKAVSAAVNNMIKRGELQVVGNASKLRNRVIAGVTRQS